MPDKEIWDVAKYDDDLMPQYFDQVPSTCSARKKGRKKESAAFFHLCVHRCMWDDFHLHQYLINEKKGEK